MNTGDETLHILGHYTKKTDVELWQYLQKWISMHMSFVAKVGKSVLERKGISVEDYVTTLVQPGTKLDELGILIFTCMFHCHIYIIMVGGVYWTTHVNHDIDRCNIFLAYHGNLTFSDTVKRIQVAYHLQP